MSAQTAVTSPELEPSQDAYEERAFGFWIYLMTDAIIFALLFATYPDAWVVQTHRDPAKTMPSTVSSPGPTRRRAPRRTGPPLRLRVLSA